MSGRDGGRRPGTGRAVLILAALLASLPAAASGPGSGAQPERPAAVRVQGPPVLQLCRDWLMWESCRHYGRGIAIPDVIRVGDTFIVAFASNVKRIRFTVADILYTGGECHLIRGSAPRVTPPDRAMDMLIVRDCVPVE
ncbi:hypothetical protein [Azospirillum halopraeferens]|uniref:hypothetical protein n=1 Tax=Azospirillum halopraeferens TaxID=34010 RepID=UPI000491CC03|nr:hypothetical protein [Azospirillum halopraeferens]